MNTSLAQLHSSDANFNQALMALLNRDGADTGNDQIHDSVARIIGDVRARGDAALVELTRRFDQFELTDTMQLDPARLPAALQAISQEQRDALEYAAERIRAYHQHQIQESWQFEEADGTVLGQKVTPLNRVGLYVPGGKAAYPSSVLMSAIPAKVAGVNEVVMVTPTPSGQVNDLVLAAAEIAGVDTVLPIGGAQAIAALAYGTQTIAKVDKITGPGNAWVAAAKQQVFGQVGIDMIAGPSEVLIIADASVQPEWVAMDMFAQAEHDERAQSILLTRDADFAQAVAQAIDELLPKMERRNIIEASLKANGAIIIASSDAELVQIANLIAAEHLEIFTATADQLAVQIDNAGAIFIGQYSAESLGDYCAGPSHVLPTSGTARFSSPLSVYDFQKRTSVIKASARGADLMAHHASVLARGESLTAHAMSAEYRIKAKD